MNERGLLWLFNETLSFKQVPPPMDYEAFGKLLLTCANGDGRISAAERAWVLGFLDAYGAPAQLLETLKTYAGTDDVAKLVASSPTVKMSATSALYDAVRACMADGDLAPGERAALEKAASALGIDASTVRDLIELHYEEEHLKNKRLRKIFPNGIPFQG
jgi:uncharacterized membrane protein YebE (DUF533 family)